MIQILTGVVFFGIGAVILLRSLVSAVQGWRSRSWPAVHGVVVSSELEHAHDTDGGLLYRLRLKYSFTVGEAVFTGTRLHFGDWLHLPVAYGAQRARKRLRPGTPVKVHHHPDRAGESVLESGVHPMTIYGMGFSGILLFFAGLMLF